MSENRAVVDQLHKEMESQRKYELATRFGAKCPEASTLKGVYYVSRPFLDDWIPMVEFRDHSDGLTLHVENQRWWLTTRSSIRQGKNILELDDDDPLFEEKLLSSINKAAL